MRSLRCIVVLLAVVGCGLPKNVARSPSSALVDTSHTTLGELIAPGAARHPGESGFLLYKTGEGAIQARVAMADTAQSSIDAQYFIWAPDTIGRVLLDRVLAAADRGVRVRLLIDDYWVAVGAISLGTATVEAGDDHLAGNPSALSGDPKEVHNWNPVQSACPGPARRGDVRSLRAMGSRVSSIRDGEKTAMHGDGPFRFGSPVNRGLALGARGRRLATTSTTSTPPTT